MTPQEITAHALALGITPQLYPEFWACEECRRPPNWHCEQCSSWGEQYGSYACTLPDPLSDDPRCAIWDGFYMRALETRNGFPTVNKASNPPLRYTVYSPVSFHGATPTAALHAAWLAKGASK